MDLIISPSQRAVASSQTSLPEISVSDAGPFNLVEGRVDRFITFDIPDYDHLRPTLTIQLALDGVTFDDISVYEGSETPIPGTTTAVQFHPFFGIHSFRFGEYGRTVTLWFTAKDDNATGTDRSFTVQAELKNGATLLAQSPLIQFNISDPSSVEFVDGTATTRSVQENTSTGTAFGDPVAATGADSLTYSLGGTNSTDFTIDTTTGQLSTEAALDYESQTSYSVTITADDGHEGSASIDVTINVTNVDEPGVVTVLDADAPYVGSELSASLADPDGEITSQAWKWQRADSAVDPTWTDISGATTASYTPTNDDVDKFLRATVSYSDHIGSSSAASGPTSEVASLPVVTVSESGPFNLVEGRIEQYIEFSLPDETVDNAVITLELALSSGASLADLDVYVSDLTPEPATDQSVTFGQTILSATIDVSDVSLPIKVWFVAATDSGSETGESFTAQYDSP